MSENNYATPSLTMDHLSIKLRNLFILYIHVLSLLDKFKVTSEHVLIIGHCPLM